MAIKALEDALREKDQAMERERDRFNKELDGERKKRNDLEIQVNNPEEGEILPQPGIHGPKSSLDPWPQPQKQNFIG